MLNTRKQIIYGALILWSCLSICSAKPREDTMSDPTSVQLHNRAKRGIGLTSTGLATVAGGLVGLLSVMGNPRLRQRIGSIGELADFRRYSRARYLPLNQRKVISKKLSRRKPVEKQCVYRLGPNCIYSVPVRRQ